jgi:hypothetical protein
MEVKKMKKQISYCSNGIIIRYSIPLLEELKRCKDVDNMTGHERKNYQMRWRLYHNLDRNLKAITARNANLKPVMSLTLEEAQLAAGRTGSIIRMKELMQYPHETVKMIMADDNERTPNSILKQLIVDSDECVRFYADKALRRTQKNRK